MADFRERRADFEGLNATIIAASVDKSEEARQTRESLGLAFPVAFGLNPEEVAAKTGAFRDPSRGLLQATGFVIRPEGKVAAAVYSTGPVGRYVAADCLRLLARLTKPV